ncbi:MAG: hypothetical protein HRT71_20070 [Flavobacteriales bacterium]|nr:hypothetical protein [Flavobacteriales bacterium]
MYPTNSYAYRNLGLVYLQLDKMNEACTVLQIALDYGLLHNYGPEVSELIKARCK